MIGDQLQPDFGPLAGVRTISCGSALAGPFAAQMMAEWGAEVIWVENPRVDDILRSGPEGLWVEAERRNQRNIALDINSVAGQDILLKLVENADILIESSRGGHFERLGLTDERLWCVNPRLVIVHVSGFGQSGDPDLVGRPSYDAIAQAFGCYMQLSGRAGDPPAPAAAFPGDYFAGLFALSASLAAVIRARDTGKGESIDVAMFEALMRAQGYGPVEYLNVGKDPIRRPEGPVEAVGMGSYSCADGVPVYVVMIGAGVIRRALTAIGVQDIEQYFTGDPFILLETESGQQLEEIIVEFCASKTSEEVESLMTSHNVPCSRIFDYRIAEEDPHYRARKVFIDWKSIEGRPVKGVKVVPEFKNRPGMVWRGGPTRGMDNDAILRDLAITDSELDHLYVSGVISRDRNDK